MVILLLHGFLGDRSSWDEVVSSWRPELPRGVELRAIDLPGHGAGPAVRQGWQANLRAVAEVAGEELAQGVVVGYSLGARVALGLVAEGLASRAVLIGVNPGLDGTERVARAAADSVWRELLVGHGVEEMVRRWDAQPLFASRLRLGPTKLARLAAIRRRHEPAALAASLAQMGLGEMPSYWPALPRLTGRVALVAGALDAKFRELACRAQQALGGAPLALVDDAGHDVLLEQPAALARALAGLVPVLAARG